MDQLQTQREQRARRRTNGSAARQEQARRAADEAARKVQSRRAKQSGAAGWVADRASKWSLDGPDWRFLEQQKYLWNPLMDYWFRM